MTTAQRRNLDSARALAARSIGWAGSPSAIPYSLREAYASALAATILAYPDRFDAQTLATARLETGDNPNSPLVTYTAADAASDFFGEAAAQAERINPLSQQNASATRWTLTAILGAAAVAAAIVYTLRVAPAPRKA